MKGLLLKDWYIMKRHCWPYLLVVAVFMTVSMYTDGNMLFVFYPCIFCGLIPLNLLAYDERSRWVQYSGTLPYTRTQIVCGKYLIGLFIQGALLLLTGTVQAVRMSALGVFAPGEFIVLMLLMLIISTLASSIYLPLVFKLGVEKGRIAHIAVVGLFVSAGSVNAMRLRIEQITAQIQPELPLVLVAVVGIGIHLLSWYLSVVFYKKRELG